jgi:hypothetical protein
MTIKILDELERLPKAAEKEWAKGNLGASNRLDDLHNEYVFKALPALIRMARAAVKVQEEVLCVLDLDHPGDRVYLDELKEALQQLRDIGGENDRV